MQNEIIELLKTKPTINPTAEIKSRVNFIKNYLQQSQMNGLVIAISGGQDSTLAGKLSKLALDELNQENPATTKKLYAVRLPYGEQKDAADAALAGNFVGADVNLEINIKHGVDACLKEVEETTHQPVSDFEKGNLKARERMQIQYLLAGMHKLLVVGTDHAAEAITGFYTKYGDGGADLVPLYGLDKRQGKQLLRELNAPETLINKVPTADLEDNQPLLPDEKALGITYDQIDDYLEGKPVEASVAKKIETKFLATAHKRKLPVTPQDK